jgi:hypothetical protein
MLFTDRLSDIHVKNLEAFPFIYFVGVHEAKLDYDIDTKGGPSYIHYDLTLTDENDSLDARFKALEVAVQALFWKEMVLHLSINGEEYKNG